MRSLIGLLLLVMVSTGLAAVPGIIAVTDLQVNSSNSKYQYIGKGIAELISFELARSKGVTLVEREKRTQLLEEMEFSLSDLADSDKQVQLGRLFAARYLVLGELIDMDTVLLISLRMIDVETGEVVWREKLDEPLASYSYISGYFARSILSYLGVQVAGSTQKVVEERKSGNAEAALALSEAIASYDRKDTARAKKSLESARRLDPRNGVVDLYLQKLSPTSAKYKVQMEVFGPSANPAVLGVLRQDRLYALQSMPTDTSKYEAKDVGDDFTMGEQNMANRSGIELPLGGRLGLAAEFAGGSFDNKVGAPFSFPLFGEDTTWFHDRETSLGGTLSVGWRALDWLSLGLGTHIYHNTVHKTDEEVWSTAVETAADLGFLLRSPDNRVIFDAHGIYTTQKEYYLDTVQQATFLDSLPLVLEGTLTTAWLNRRLFAVMKGLGDVYYDRRRGVVIRAIPAVEFWPFRFLSLRGAYQLTVLTIDGRDSSGHGFMAGTTVRLGRYDLDFNFTSRYQPGRVLPGYGKRENFILIGLSRSEIFPGLSR